MRIHHLNCVSSCPLGGRLFDGRSPSILQRGALCCHCLLLETADGLTLVDTGFGTADVRNPRSRLSGFFLTLLSPDFREEMTAVRQIERHERRLAAHHVEHHLECGGIDVAIDIERRRRSQECQAVVKLRHVTLEQHVVETLAICKGVTAIPWP